jgi:hypothetical protein
MKQLELRDTLEFRQGREFEQGYARRCIQVGYRVIRQYALEIGSKAPMIDGPFKGLRLPDLQVFKDAKAQWHECKEKTNATYTYSEHRNDHGIGLACYHDYVEVQRISGFTVFLVIGEWKTGTILVQSLNNLGPPRTYSGPNMPRREAMAFWPRSLFDVWGYYERDPNQVDLPLSLRPKNRILRYSPKRWAS